MMLIMVSCTTDSHLLLVMKTDEHVMTTLMKKAVSSTLEGRGGRGRFVWSALV